MISKLLVITDGRRFCNIKETDNNSKYITHVGVYFSLGSTVQPKLFVISRILAEFCFSLRVNSTNPNIRRIFLQHAYFQIADWGSSVRYTAYMCAFLTHIRLQPLFIVSRCILFYLIVFNCSLVLSSAAVQCPTL